MYLAGNRNTHQNVTSPEKLSRRKISKFSFNYIAPRFIKSRKFWPEILFDFSENCTSPEKCPAIEKQLFFTFHAIPIIFSQKWFFSDPSNFVRWNSPCFLWLSVSQFGTLTLRTRKILVCVSATGTLKLRTRKTALRTLTIGAHKSRTRKILVCISAIGTLKLRRKLPY